jgi:hypothetical protein
MEATHGRLEQRRVTSVPAVAQDDDDGAPRHEAWPILHEAGQALADARSARPSAGVTRQAVERVPIRPAAEVLGVRASRVLNVKLSTRAKLRCNA